MNASSTHPDTPYKTPYKIVRIHLKGASSEVTNMVAIPQQAISPQIGVDMQTLATPAWPGALECVLRITLHARLEGKTVFIIEVSEAGVFELDVSDMEDVHHFVRKIAPSILFPFARRDLASLTVAAGFQPILLDHIDFDSILAHLIKSQRWARSTAPIRLDVIAAKPAAQAAVAAVSALAAARPAGLLAAVSLAAEGKAEPRCSDIQPPGLPADQVEVALSEQFGVTEKRGMPLLMGLSPRRDKDPVKPANNKLRNKALAVLCVSGVAAVIAWWIQLIPTGTDDTKLVAESTVNAKILPPTALQASAPAAAPTTAKPVASAETQRAINLSQERLADQPSKWFTLDLGLSPADTPLASLYPTATDRPMFVQADQNGSIRLLYGVFPTRVAAEQVNAELALTATVVSIGSL